MSAGQLVWFVVCEEGWDLCEKCSDNQIMIPQLSSFCQFLFLLKSDLVLGLWSGWSVKALSEKRWVTNIFTWLYAML